MSWDGEPREDRSLWCPHGGPDHRPGRVCAWCVLATGSLFYDDDPHPRPVTSTPPAPGGTPTP